MEALVVSLGTLLVVAGYMVVKRMARSNCAVDSGCLQCESPAVEMQKKQTERLDELFEMIKKMAPKSPPVSPISLTPDHFAADRPTTNEVPKASNN